MANVTTSQILENGPSRLVMKFTSLSDSTPETGVVKVDATSATIGVQTLGSVFPPGPHLVVTGVEYDVKGMVLRIQWDGTDPVDMLLFDGCGPWKFRDVRAGFGGLTCVGVAGATGSILFTTSNAADGSSYSVVLHMLKGVPQNGTAPVPPAPPSGASIGLEDGTGAISLEDGSGTIALEG